MAGFDFLKKKKGEGKKPNEVPAPTEVPSRNKTDYSDSLNELPEFPTMPDEKVTPLPRIEPNENLNKNDVTIPSLNEEKIHRPIFKEKVMHDFNEQNNEKRYERRNVPEFPPSFAEEKNDIPKFNFPASQEKKDEENEKSRLKERVKPQKRNVFEHEGPLFVNVKRYSGIINYIDISGIAKNFELSINEIEKVREKDNSELKNLKNSLEGLQKKIMVIDDIISKG
jgi:hypothetical protein